MRRILIKDSYPNVTIGSEEAILNIDTGNYIFINEVGSQIWAIINEQAGISQGEIVNMLVATYDVSREMCEREVTAFINSCFELGIISYMEV